MKIALICSQLDQAGMNMKEQLCEHFSQSTETFDSYPVLQAIIGKHDVSLYTIQTQTVYAEKLDEKIQADIFLFITKHASQSGIPSFCIHTQGNWSTADYGGNSFEIGNCPIVLKNHLYSLLVEKNQFSHEVVNEATHHGPSLQKPTLFFEIGSTQKEWSNPEYGIFMSDIIIQGLQTYNGEESSLEAIFGIGGNHTCANFNRISGEKKIVLGHVCPNYKIADLTKEMITQGMNNSTIPCKIVVDWNALKSEHKIKIRELLTDDQYIKLKDLKKRL